jgi:preprotein translocase subunit SecA
MAMTAIEMAQRGHHFAIVDEVDSILIDEARTPLIISGRVEDSSDWYKRFAQIVKNLRRDRDYEVDEAKHTVAVTEDGVDRVEAELGIDNLYDQVNNNLVHHLQASLKAKELYKREVEYIVQGGEVLIVDEFTGRILQGRRYSEGLHQAIEAKEGVKIKEENQTLATITLQNYFRMYDKLSGMTGTAMTEASEFAHIYSLECVPIPTNVQVARSDKADVIYKSEEAKFNALVDDIVGRYEVGQPVLVGTVSVEKSEKLSRYLDRRGVPHSVLNAKYHEREASIIAQAGRLKAVTVATNMAGRGVDIQLGGNPEGMAKEELARQVAAGELEFSDELLDRLIAEMKVDSEPERSKVKELGGLFVLGTERHESRRIDNQLRGRSGRQGDPGESRFYLSLEDELMRLFAADRIDRIMTMLKVPDDVPIESGMVSKAVERAQSQVEARNFDIRKNILKYDDVLNEQRKIVYRRRHASLEGEDMREDALNFVVRVVEGAVEQFCGEGYPEEWDLDELMVYMRQLFPTRVDVEALGPKADLTVEALVEAFTDDALTLYEEREEEFGAEIFREIERRVFLQILDYKWREHLYEMDYLLEGINLRAMGQQDPLVAYQTDGSSMFRQMEDGIREEFVRYIFHVQQVREEPVQRRRVRMQQGGRSALPVSGSAVAEAKGEEEAAAEPEKEQARSDKTPRNAPCPCGSGRKFKFCHGK